MATKSKKKTLTKGFEEKISSHRRLVKKFSKKMSETFMVNRLVGDSISTLDVDPFEFITTIDVLKEIEIKSININGVLSKRDEFEEDDKTIKCSMKAFSSTDTFLLIIKATSETPGIFTEFNISCDGTDVFKKKQKIEINDKGRGGYNNPDVPLP